MTTKRLIAMASMAILLMMAGSLVSCESTSDVEQYGTILITGKLSWASIPCPPDMVCPGIDGVVVRSNSAIFMLRKNGLILTGVDSTDEDDVLHNFRSGDIITVYGVIYEAQYAYYENFYFLEIIKIVR